MRFESRLLTEDELKRSAVHSDGLETSRAGSFTSKPACWTGSPWRRPTRPLRRGAEDSMVIASRTDSVFDPHGKLANSWRTIGEKATRSGHIYAGGMSYAKISRLKQPAGLLLVEFHCGLHRAGGLVSGSPDPALEIRTDRPGPDSQAAPRAAQEPAELAVPASGCPVRTCRRAIFQLLRSRPAASPARHPWRSGVKVEAGPAAGFSMANDQETGTVPSSRSALTLRGQSKTRSGSSSTSLRDVLTALPGLLRPDKDPQGPRPRINQKA